ncbi:cell cycle checkpoint protein RAD17 isoform X2 [Cheilinus undulatus]|uniref:cell cycle checkpoint protein RAD17 isoform X2 n=1 Tax=Cheilinus undulatus TaxID=241271 RepID=UPI001BD441EA|nr:cell cycle checkpoint protein RAD17 isoform X2 [Cheilinus undulatus]
MNRLTVGEKPSQSRLNRWVDPSFSEFPADSFSRPVKKKGVPVLKVACEQKRSRKRKGGSCDVFLTARGEDEPWVDRYAPSSQAELAVHRKKIEEVESWMRAHTHSSQRGVLLLTGPSGCGKTATVRVLSEEMGLRVQEWTNPTSMEPYDWRARDSSGWRLMDSTYSTSQVTQFQDFLLRANRYSCLRMSGDGRSSDRKIILVEDFPNQFYRQPSSLHDILRRFVKTSRCPLVFIVSDSLSGDSSSRFLFPREIQEELHISSISFNPVAPTTMMKVLTRISAVEVGKSGGRMCVSDPALLESLCSGSSGDIRSAVNSLQFSSLPDSSLEHALWKTKKERTASSAGKSSRTKQRKKKEERKPQEEEEQAIGGKDASLFLFRALGKILHCKRGTDEEAEPAPSVPALPSHLSHHQRGPLLIDPEMVVERSHMSGEFFNLYLHQNYLDFFSEVDDVERASEYLSDADLLTSDWTSRSTMGGYSSSVATRGLLHSNCQQVSVGFRPLHKPNWLLVHKKHRENCLAAQSLFRSFCLSPISLQTHLLPLLAKLSNPMRNQAQIAFIQDVGQMSLRRGLGRLKLEALTDKDPAQQEEEEEEEEKSQGDEDLSASQPKAVSSQILLEEDELLIEEYNSD